MNRSDSIRRGLIYLSGEQRPDGGFIGHATADEHDFSHYREHPTPFFTALILCGLSGVAGASRIRRRAGQFLLEQRGERWSWNYWLRESDEAYNRPYPDDLDDTACALASLSLSAPGKVDGQALGYLARHLIANEAAPGGPYETWLIDRTAHPDWHDIDLAVNANISFCLDTQQVRVPELEAYLTQALRAGKLRSAYYIGEAPLLYFMARGYHGPALDALRRRLTTAVQTSHHSSALELALLLAAGAKVGLPKINLEPLCKRLLRQQQADGSWPAAALYYEPPIDGQVYYAGSAALTTGLALQAITSFGQLKTAKSAALYQHQPGNQTIKLALEQAAAIADATLRQQYQNYISRLAKRDQDGQITAMASLTATACGKQSPPSVITHLNLASLNGWIAYTIYDDFLDNEGQPELLGVANLAARRSVANFHQALPAKAAFQSLVASVFDQVDTANQWETLRARAIWQGEDLSLPDLPDYGNYSQLADRSWGHWLAAAGVFYALGYAPDSPEVANLQTFFHHFLIARQLNDDAHDWEEDLRAGRLSAAVTLLLRSVMPEGSALTRDDIVYLRQQFWETTIVDIVAVIQKHLTAAQTALRSCPALVDHRTFDNWLTKLRHATERALSERQEAQKFIASYSHD